MIESIILSFLSLFVATDAVGIVPLYLSLTRELSADERKRVAKDSIFTACVVGIIFVLGGKIIFQVLGITVPDFAIAGGLLLFTFSILELLKKEDSDVKRRPDPSLGVFPIGTPLIAGPAVLTTLIIMVDTHGFIATLIAFGLNLLILAISLFKADLILFFLGQSGARAFAKIMSILLAAIGIMMVRRGVMELIVNSK